MLAEKGEVEEEALRTLVDSTIEEAFERARRDDYAMTDGWEDDELPSKCKLYIPDDNEYEVISRKR